MCRCVCVCATSRRLLIGASRPRDASRAQKAKVVVYSFLRRLDCAPSSPAPPFPSYPLLQLISLPPAAFLLPSSRNTSISFLIFLRFFHAFLSYISSFFICLFFVLFSIITLLSCDFDEIYLFLRDVMHITVSSNCHARKVRKCNMFRDISLSVTFLDIFFTNVHLFWKDLVIEHGINPIPLSLRHSLLSLLLPSSLSPFASSPFGLAHSLSIPDRLILLPRSHPLSPADSAVLGTGAT